MELRSGLVVAGVSMACSLQAYPAQARGPSTPEERARVVALARLLERDPFAENAAATRLRLREWVVEVPDIRVYVCAELLGGGLGEAYPYSSEIGLQPMFSAAAFAIEHPDKARDEIAQYTAGLEGALRAYEALLRSRPDARSAFLDDLLARRGQGALADHVASVANEKCKRANTDLIASLAGAGVALVLGLVLARWFPRDPARRLTGAASRRVVLACAAYFVIVLAVLHVLEPDFDPRYRFMSEYVWGTHGWLMTTAFVALGLAPVTVALGLRRVHQSSWSARLGFGMLAVGAVSIWLAGAFKDFLPHLLASAVAIPGVILATLLLSWSFGQAEGWKAIHGATLSIAFVMLAAFLSINLHLGPPGLLQRVFIFLFLVWLSIVADRMARLRPPSIPSR